MMDMVHIRKEGALMFYDTIAHHTDDIQKRYHQGRKRNDIILSIASRSIMPYKSIQIDYQITKDESEKEGAGVTHEELGLFLPGAEDIE